jgi:peptidoglycan/LPS O-acetylase OafA/YrhL
VQRHDSSSLGRSSWSRGDTASSKMSADEAVATGSLAPSAHNHLSGLDGMRGIAVLLVLVYHFTSNYTDEFIGKHSFTSLLYQFPNVGWCGVDVFFVLSGFLITGILCDAKGAPQYFLNFYMRRVLRIFPLYYGFLLVLFVFVPRVTPFPQDIRDHIGEQVWFWGYGMNLYYAMPSHLLLDGLGLQHFWSLAVEEQFYLIWPFVIFFSSSKTAIRISIFCIVSALAFRLLLVADHANPLAIYNLTAGRTDGLAVGALCALAVRFSAKIGRVLKMAGLATILSILGLLVILLLRGWSWDDPVMETVGISLVSFFSGGILLLSLDPKSNRVSWLLSCPILTTFGFYSYAIYVFHFPLRVEFDKWFPVEKLSFHLHSLSLGLAAYVLCSTLVSFVVAVLSWHLYEKHFIKLKKYFVHTKIGAEVAEPAGVRSTPIVHLRRFFVSATGNLVAWIQACPF